MSEQQPEYDPFAPASPPSPPPAPAPAEEPRAAARSRALSRSDGEFSDPPALPPWPGADTSPEFDYKPQDVSFDDLRSVNMEILRLRTLQANLGREMGSLGRRLTEAEIAYDRAKRRALLKQSGGSAESRKAAAEYECEELEGHVEVLKRSLENLTTRFRAVRDDQQVLTNLSSNIRSAMKL